MATAPISPATAATTELLTGDVDRRSFLKFVGLGVTAASAGSALGPLARPAMAQTPTTADGHFGAPWVKPDGTPDWVAPKYPIPIPGDGGTAATDPTTLAEYIVQDDIVLPDGWRWDVVAQWGDQFGPTPKRGETDQRIQVGFNHDYTGLVKIPGTTNEYYLIINHEYISARPWLQGYTRATGKMLPMVRLLEDADDVSYPAGRFMIDGVLMGGNEVDLKDARANLSDAQRKAINAICDAALGDLGISVLHVIRLSDGRFDVVRGSKKHRRISGITKPVGTYSNCSGATTPWGTFLTCEENFQDQVPEFITYEGNPLPDARRPFAGNGADGKINLPFEFEGLGTGTSQALDGREFGWVCHIDPGTGGIEKLKRLGRFRHENVAMRCEPGKPLAAYMGDDRRGGHVWKFISDDIVRDPADPANINLLKRGVLCVAKFNPDYTGEWIPLEPSTPVATPQPEHMATGHMWLPRGFGGHVAVGTKAYKKAEFDGPGWIQAITDWKNVPADRLTLGHLVAPLFRPDEDVTDSLIRERMRDILLMDAYAMANAIGGTPCARPEDIEVHPFDHSVYIAFTDSTGSGDGSPDVRIFPDSARQNSRQYGAIYRLVEDGDTEGGDPAATSFKWGKFVASGEAADGGGGFACADNLVFDPQGNLWMVCDISTPYHNFPVNRQGDSAPGMREFPGVFGNNAMFMIPTYGPKAGVPQLFCIGPMECELTGPTFTEDGKTLILSVQHPGELWGTRMMRGSGIPAQETRELKIAARDGTLFTQKRTVPLGSNFPSGIPGEPPRPCTVCITRTA